MYFRIYDKLSKENQLMLSKFHLVFNIIISVLV